MRTTALYSSISTAIHYKLISIVVHYFVVIGVNEQLHSVLLLAHERLKNNLESRAMQTQHLKTRMITITAIIFALALFRLLPHLPNVSPVAAMALFGGAYFADKRMAFIVPFLALFISDLFLGLHNSMIFVYAGFALTVVIGFQLQKRVNVTNTAFAVVVSSVLFFLLTNFGAWLTSGLYAKTAAGLMQAYVAGIPFFQNSLLGNLVYAAVIFGGYHLLQKNVASLKAPVVK